MSHDLPRRLFAPRVPAFTAGMGGRIVKSVGAKTSPEAVLTYPIRDLQGDVVDPSGIDWTEFNTLYERLVNLEHGPYIGTASVEYKSLPVLNKARQPDESLGMIRLPVGVTTFFDSARDAARHTLRRFDGAGRVVGTYSPDACARYAEQAYPLVADGTLSGVSLEFRPAGPEGTAYKSLGKSPMLARDAYHFFQTTALGYAAACELPVNPVAGYAVASDEVMAKAEKALRVLEKPGTLELVRKSLRPLADLLKSNPKNRVTRSATMPATKPAQRVRKAVEDELLDPMGGGMDSADEPLEDPAEMVEESAADDMKPTPAALFQFAQALKDACMMADDMAAKGEHMQGVKALKKFCEQVEGIADKVTAMAEKVAGAVAGDEVEIDVEADMDADAPPMETDEDGGLMSKSLSAQKWRPIRFIKATPYTLKHLKGKPKAGKVEVDAEYLKNLEILAEAVVEARQ